MQVRQEIWIHRVRQSGFTILHASDVPQRSANA